VRFPVCDLSVTNTFLMVFRICDHSSLIFSQNRKKIHVCKIKKVFSFSQVFPGNSLPRIARYFTFYTSTSLEFPSRIFTYVSMPSPKAHSCMHACGNTGCKKLGSAFRCSCTTISYCSMKCFKAHESVHHFKCVNALVQVLYKERDPVHVGHLRVVRGLPVDHVFTSNPFIIDKMGNLGKVALSAGLYTISYKYLYEGYSLLKEKKEAFLKDGGNFFYRAECQFLWGIIFLTSSLGQYKDTIQAISRLKFLVRKDTDAVRQRDDIAKMRLARARVEVHRCNYAKAVNLFSKVNCLQHISGNTCTLQALEIAAFLVVSIVEMHVRLEEFDDVEILLKIVLRYMNRMEKTGDEMYGRYFYLWGKFYLAKGFLDDAFKNFKISLQSFRKLSAVNHPVVHIAFYGLGDYYMQKGGYVNAKRMYSKGMHLLSKNMPKGVVHFELANGMTKLATALIKQGVYFIILINCCIVF
jgi:tetratricopeptide (TPR) repeat protein